MNYSNALQKDDYEKYKIPLTFFQAFPKINKNYIWGELEKRHPCFSDDYCYFTKLNLSKKGFYSDVFVIEKSKISKYKNNFFLLDNKKLKVFFKRNRTLILIAAASLLFILIFFIYINKFQFTNTDDSSISKESSSLFNYSPNNQYKNVNKSIVQDYFNIVSENNGIIENIKWKLNYNSEYFSSSVTGVYPELLEKEFSILNLSPVVYKANTPLLNFYILNEFEITKNENQYQRKEDLNKKEVLRNFLKENKINLIEECNNPYKLIFNLFIDNKNNEKLKKIFLDFQNKIEQLNIAPIEIEIMRASEKNNNSSLNMAICFSNDINFSNSMLKLLGNNLNLFLNNSNPINIKKIKTNNIEQLEVKVDDQKKYIGEVNYKSGKKIIFYKTLDGKILKEEVKNES